MAALTTRVSRGGGSIALVSALGFALAFGCGDEPSDGPGGGAADAGSSGGECNGVTATVDGDGCCPAGANANDDDDCAPVCGNGAIEAGEQCDDGNTASGDGCDAACMNEAEPTAFRLTTLSLREPHTFALGFVDVTDTVNGLLNDFVGMDKVNPAGEETPDGLLDFSLLAVFRPLDQSVDTVPLDIVIADCAAPMESTSCQRTATSQVVSSVATNLASDCLEVMPDTTGGYNPPITTPSGPCFVSDAETFDLDFGDIAFSFVDARLGAMYPDGEGNQLASGLIRGFLSQSFAEGATLPADIPVVGGQPIASLLKDVDKDTGPGGEAGWWFYLNFTAEAVPYSD